MANIDIQDQTGRLGTEDRQFDRSFDKDMRRDWGDDRDRLDRSSRRDWGDKDRNRDLDRGLGDDWRRRKGRGLGRMDDMNLGYGRDLGYGRNLGYGGGQDLGWNRDLGMGRDLGWNRDLGMGRDLGYGMGRDLGYGMGRDLGYGRDLGMGRDLGYGMDRNLGYGRDLGMGRDFGLDMGMGYGMGRGGLGNLYSSDLGMPLDFGMMGPDLGYGMGDLGMGRGDLGMGRGDLGMGMGMGGLGGRRIDEGRYMRLPHYNKILENPNIDENTLWRPRADIFEEDPDHLRVEFELPGVPKEDISLTVQDNILTLAAIKPQTRKEETGFHYQNERHFGKFYRRLMLPFVVDPNNVRAHMDNGVLKVHLARMAGVGGRIPIAASEATATGQRPMSGTSMSQQSGGTATRT